MPRDRDVDDYAMAVVKGMALTALIIFLMGVLLGRCAFAQNGRHGEGHAQGHEIYKDWKARDGQSCCNDGDCRPTRAYVDENGRWRAWDGEEWVIIPQRAMLPPDYFGDGRSHYCGRRNGFTTFPYCFTPGEIRG